MTAPDTNIKLVIAGSDPTPEITKNHFAFGKEYLGFQLSGAVKKASNSYVAVYKHPSGRCLVNVTTKLNPTNTVTLRCYEQILLADIRRDMN